MTWNYRIFKHTEKINISPFKKYPWSKTFTYFALHEAYYDENGKVNGWTQKAMTESRDTVEELIGMLEIQLADARRFQKDILDYK